MAGQFIENNEWSFLDTVDDRLDRPEIPHGRWRGLGFSDKHFDASTIVDNWLLGTGDMTEALILDDVAKVALLID